MPGVRRVIVGTSGSPGSLRALRYAEDLARANNATLIPVLTWVPPGGDLADRHQPCGYLRRIWQEDARQQLRDALIAAWGEIPGGPPVQPLTARRGWLDSGPSGLLPRRSAGRGCWPPWCAGPARLRQGEPLLPSPRRVPSPRRSAARTRPGSGPWPAQVGGVAPDPHRGSGPSGPGQGSRIGVRSVPRGNPAARHCHHQRDSRDGWRGVSG